MKDAPNLFIQQVFGEGTGIQYVVYDNNNEEDGVLFGPCPSQERTRGFIDGYIAASEYWEESE